MVNGDMVIRSTSPAPGVSTPKSTLNRYGAGWAAAVRLSGNAKMLRVSMNANLILLFMFSSYWYRLN
jgi:hypothetical protein